MPFGPVCNRLLGFTESVRVKRNRIRRRVHSQVAGPYVACTHCMNREAGPAASTAKIGGCAVAAYLAGSGAVLGCLAQVQTALMGLGRRRPCLTRFRLQPCAARWQWPGRSGRWRRPGWHRWHPRGSRLQQSSEAVPERELDWSASTGGMAAQPAALVQDPDQEHRGPHLRRPGRQCSGRQRPAGRRRRRTWRRRRRRGRRWRRRCWN